MYTVPPAQHIKTRWELVQKTLTSYLRYGAILGGLYGISVLGEAPIAAIVVGGLMGGSGGFIIGGVNGLMHGFVLWPWLQSPETHGIARRVPAINALVSALIGLLLLLLIFPWEAPSIGISAWLNFSGPAVLIAAGAGWVIGYQIERLCAGGVDEEKTGAR